jgi:hypothetical protein
VALAMSEVALSGGAPAQPAAAEDVGDRWLERVALLFTLAVIVHNADHLRRGVGLLHRDVFWAGTSGIVVEVALVVLICQRHRLAPLASLVGGLGLAAGYIEVHFLPKHRYLSDSFTSAAHASWLSWGAASAEVVAALALAAVGALVLRRRGGLGQSLEPRAGALRLANALQNPIAALMVVSQILGLAISFTQAYG